MQGELPQAADVQLSAWQPQAQVEAEAEAAVEVVVAVAVDA